MKSNSVPDRVIAGAVYGTFLGGLSLLLSAPLLIEPGGSPLIALGRVARLTFTLAASGALVGAGLNALLPAFRDRLAALALGILAMTIVAALRTSAMARTSPFTNSPTSSIRRTVEPMACRGWT